MFTIRSLDRNVVEYAGPQYVPAREDAWSSTFELLPGRYSVEVYDRNGDGLFSGGFGTHDGAWQLVADYDYEGGAPETELARGDSGFFITEIHEFVVNDRPLESCMSTKSFEEQAGSTLGVMCECNTNDGQVELVCRNSNDEVCATNHSPCGTSTVCCGNRQCSNGLCRASSKAPGKQSVAQLEDGSIGGADRTSRGGTNNNNLRRQLIRGEKRYAKTTPIE